MNVLLLGRNECVKVNVLFYAVGGSGLIRSELQQGQFVGGK